MSSSSSLDLTGLEYVGTIYELLGADIDLPLPPDEWKLAAIQVLTAYSGMTVHNNYTRTLPS